MWQANLSNQDIILSVFGKPGVVHYSHTENIREVSLAFDQNANPYFAFVSESGVPYLRWYDLVEGSMVTTQLDSDVITPRITLDDARQFNVGNSDVILAYIREGVIRYRRQRDRFGVEYTPTQGEGGDVAEISFLKHVSMNSSLRLEFISGDEEDPYIFLEANPDFAQTTSTKSVSPVVLQNDLYYGNVVQLEDLDDLPKVIRPPIIGSVSVNPDGTINFTPPRGFRGVITFEYEIKASPKGDD